MKHGIRLELAGLMAALAVVRPEWRNRIAELAQMPATLVMFETGPRLAAALADLSAGLGPRPAAVCRELTKLHEQVHRGVLPDVPTEADFPRKGELTVVIEGKRRRQSADDS